MKRVGLWMVVSVVVAGCAYEPGELVIDDVQVRNATGTSSELKVQLHNGGDLPVWVRSNLPALYEDNDTLVVAFHDGTPMGRATASVDTPAVKYLKVSTDPLRRNSDGTLTLTLLSSLLSRDKVRVELGWNRENPGSPRPEVAPEYDDLTLGEWVR